MKNLICLLIVAFLATTTFAQRKGMALKADAAIERMTTDLNLTPEQQVQIKAIYESRTADKTSRNEQTKESRMAARTEFNDKIEAVLTPEQIETRNTLKATKKKGMKAKRAERKESGLNSSGKKGQRLGNMTPEMIDNRAVKSTERLNKQVSLTEEQQVAAKTAYLNFYQKNQAIAADTSLDAAAKKEMLSQLKKDHKEEIKSMLTEEQMAARKANKKTKKPNRKAKEQL